MKSQFVLILLCTLLIGIFIPVSASPTKNPNFVTHNEVQYIIRQEITKLGLMNKTQIVKLINCEIAKRKFVTAEQVRIIIQTEIAKLKILTEAEVQQLANAEIDKRGLLTPVQVQAMIDATIVPIQTTITDLQTRVTVLENQQSQPSVDLPFDFVIGTNGFDFSGVGPSVYQEINIVPAEGIQFIDEWAFPKNAQCWGIMHLPLVSLVSFSTAAADITWWNIPADLIPPSGTSVLIESHIFYAGKNWDFETILLIPSQSSNKPTYTTNNTALNHGNYGNSSIPCIISDETGHDLFDGNYGKTDWFKRATVLSDADYYNRYEDQNGYGIPWVSWQSYTTPAVITIDLKEVQQIKEIGVHCYYRTPDILLPNMAEIEISNDGVEFHLSGTSGGSGSVFIKDDGTGWIGFGAGAAFARYIRLTIHTDAPGNLFIDEISINGRDGDNY